MTSADPLDRPVRFVRGIGPKRADALAGQGIVTVRDLLSAYPTGYIDSATVDDVAALRGTPPGGPVRTVIGVVRSVELLGRPPRQRLVVLLEDRTGTLQLVFFEGLNYLKRAFAAGDLLAAAGRVTRFRSQPQLVHPTVDRLQPGGEEGETPEGFLHTGGIIPKYGSSRDLRDVRLHVRGLRTVVRNALTDHLRLVREVLPPEILRRRSLAGIREALEAVHFPPSHDALEAARRRLKYEELFLMQTLLLLRREAVRGGPPGIAFRVESGLARRLVDALPFTLTAAQTAVINEIARDMRDARPMNRLLQGDVGSGKTIVALVAALIAVDNGYQAVLMAPTELLAEQHHRTMSGLCDPLGVPVSLLTGGRGAAGRAGLLDRISAGEPGVVVGTHALIQEGVRFGRLGLAVIDEQHRFGVSQRLALRERNAAPGGPGPDLLVMTATPIPRTLSLTLYGDLDVSVIGERPPGRRPIETAIRFERDRSAVETFIRREVSAGRQAYIVYPLVDESEKLDLKAASASYDRLRSEVFPEISTGLVHGRMPAEERDRVMSAFAAGEIRILVATTVIEVGIDVPNASVMVIEHAERFGLSQLHQLRGRVGRGSARSYAILMAPDWMRRVLASATPPPAGPGESDDRTAAVRRLGIIASTENGFEIAENDMIMRGPGEFFGTRQAGLPRLKIADLLTDRELLDAARSDVAGTIERDPHLRLDEHRELREIVARQMAELLPLTRSG